VTGSFQKIPARFPVGSREGGEGCDVGGFVWGFTSCRLTCGPQLTSTVYSQLGIPRGTKQKITHLLLLLLPYWEPDIFPALHTPGHLKIRSLWVDLV